MEVKFKNFDIYEYFRKLALKNNSLFAVEFDVTPMCNADCCFCYQGNHSNSNCKNALSLNEYINIFRDLKNLGTYSLGFSGGEPFCRKDFTEILSVAKKTGFRISFITNAQLISTNQLNELSKIKPESINVSFHSLDSSIYNKIFGVNNSRYYETALKNIKEMLRLGLNVGIAITVTKYNIDESEQLIHFFTSLGIPKERISFNMLLKGSRNIDNLRPSYEQIYRNRKYLNHKHEYNGFICSAGRISCSINHQGQVYPCTFFNTPVGNVRHEKIQDIWCNSHFLKIIRNFNESYYPKCIECENNKSCQICMVTNLNETGNIFIPSNEHCKSRKEKAGL